MEKKKSAESSRPGKLITRSEKDIRSYAKSPAAKATAARLNAAGPEPSAADLTEIPELTSEELATLYRVRKKPITVRLDVDILHWLKSKGGRYQQHLNAALRHRMLADIGKQTQGK